MSENHEVTVPASEQIPARVGGISAIGSAHAPIVYFDIAGAYGIEAGVGVITLTAARIIPDPQSNGTVRDHVVTAHLRMGNDGLLSLKNAIDGLLLMAHGKPEGQAAN